MADGARGVAGDARRPVQRAVRAHRNPPELRPCSDGRSDFTRNGQPYTYDDLPAGQTDPGLAHFSITHDQAYIIPALRQALAVNPQTEFLASPWSPPAWMKGNDALGNAGDQGTLRGPLRPWGEYIVKFIQAYAARRRPDRR